MAERTDTDLLRGAARGDDAALTGLYERHVDGLYAFVFYRVGRDRQLAEDVVQATFLHALEHADEFDARRGSFRAWLHTSSRNVLRTSAARSSRYGGGQFASTSGVEGSSR